jgi:mono/diheme cytochrome c family protein
MKKLSLLLVVAGLFVFLATSFEYSKVEPLSSDAETIAIPQDDPAAAKYPNGAKIYNTKCFVCHQATGLGVPGAFPPLKNSDYLMADKKRAVAQVLNGSNEAMVVNGETYTIPMPFQVDTHQDAVDVINYVLNAWGNNGGEITLEEVKDIKIVR